jgi:hypothetical protein
MPEISRFYGIVITIYWERDTQHHIPHFHAIYNEFDCKYGIPKLNILDGSLPNKAHRMVIEWASKHLYELDENWKLAIKNEPINKIEPLI